MSRGAIILVSALLFIGGVLYFLLNISGGRKMNARFQQVGESMMSAGGEAASGKMESMDVPVVEDLVVKVPKNAWRRNPFFPVFKPTVPVAGGAGEPVDTGAGVPRLQGIVWSGSTGKALINGEFVGKGDVVAGWRVSKVEKSSVSLVRGTRRITLKLFNIKGKVTKR